MQRFLLSATLVFATSATCHAQEPWIPYSAHFSDTVTLQGQAPSIVEGVRCRNSGGDLAESDYAPSSKKVIKSSLYSASESIHYDINPDKRQALGTHQHLGRLNVKDTVLGHEIVENYPTTIYPMRGPNKQISGKIWIINGTDIIMRMHFAVPGGTDDFQLTDVKLYQDPDKSLFTIPSGFEISKPQ